MSTSAAETEARGRAGDKHSMNGFLGVRLRYDEMPTREGDAEVAYGDCFIQRINKFLHSVQEAYSESWESHVTCVAGTNKEVIRGRARCIAGRVEDLFAEALYDVLSECIQGLLVFVDLPLSYELDEYDDNGKKRKDICYPDVVVAQRKENQINILYLVELKVNLGWGRHKLAGEMFVKAESGGKVKKSITPIEAEITHELEELIGKRVWSKIPFGMKSRENLQGVMNDGELHFVVSNDTRYDLIICSSKNVPKAALQKARERIGSDESAICQMYVLSDAELSLKYADEKKKIDNDVMLCSHDVRKWKSRIGTLVGGLDQL